MSIWWLVFVLGSLLAAFFGFMWVVLRVGSGGGGKKKSVNDLNKSYADIAAEDVDHLFNKEFREELRNRGRLRFEKIIDENAMFLKQDLDLTIAQLNDYMKKEISKNLNEEFAAYAKGMHEAQELAINSLKATAAEVDQERVALSEALQKDVDERKAVLITQYEQNMAQIVEHYVLAALGEQFELKAQLPYIIKQLEANKEDIVGDMKL